MSLPPTKTTIDWASKPEPWCWIGPQLRRECEAIASGDSSIHNSLRERRKKLGLTQAKLAGIVGLSCASIVSRAERGEMPGPAATIAAALDRLEAE